MNTRYYKTNHPDVLAADATFEAQRKALNDSANAFAAAFGGKGLTYNNPRAWRATPRCRHPTISISSKRLHRAG